MIRLLPTIAMLLLAAAVNAEQPEPRVDDVHILVTIADDGASRIDLSGPPGPGYRRRDRYFASLPAERAAEQLADDFGLTRVDDWPIRPLKVFCLVYAVPPETAVDELLLALEKRPEVATAQRMNEFVVMATATTGGEDPYAGLQHTLETLELRSAHRWTTGRGVDIALIDTGADYTHPDLRSQIADYRDFVERDKSQFRQDWHGTAVAGVIVAASGNGYGIVGVAPAARLAVLKACWYEPERSGATCNSFTVAKALAHAIESEAQIINLSLAGPADRLLADLVAAARRQGIIVVAAAPDDSARGFPAGEPGVIAVGLSKGTASTRAADRVFAPGDDILVTMPDGRFDYLSGSSLAAAHVSGIVALLVAIRPGLEPAEIRQRMLASQDSNSDSVNACRAVAGLVDDAVCRKPSALVQAVDGD